MKHRYRVVGTSTQVSGWRFRAGSFFLKISAKAWANTMNRASLRSPHTSHLYWHVERIEDET